MSHPVLSNFQQANKLVQAACSDILGIIASLEYAQNDIVKGTDLDSECDSRQLLAEAARIWRSGCFSDHVFTLTSCS
jgi:hypothetical protein